MARSRLSKFLLDANLSPRTARYLRSKLGLDAVSLFQRGLGELADRDVLDLANREGRVLISLDRDFLEPQHFGRSITRGLIFLDLPSELRYVDDVNSILERFFVNEATSLELEQSIVILQIDRIRIKRISGIE